ncbi:MAG TPA: hypothetical protein VG223_17930 [Solirubrobacteraceae bacterium]|jgi:hypothetical protein|nr:hypothetical protein [Solirubrobacteraceae bacterium]
MTTPAFCTILATNYLPSALALSDSLRRFDTGDRELVPLHVFLIDATPETELPELDGVRWMTPWSLGLPERTVLELAMSYDLVEFATAIKPLLLQVLLAEYEQVAYLDPDTYQVSPMVELSPALRDGAGIVLTPHYLEPTPPGNAFTEGHLLNVGVYNLGFCAVDRKAEEMLKWWWSHLSSECLHDPLAGLFVDQKWMDIGSVLFGATSLRHYGYNVGVGNLHERRIERDDDGYYVTPSRDRLRLFHFHAFDALRPEALYTRPATGSGTGSAADGGEALKQLCHEYAAIVLGKRELLGPAPAYRYNSDTSGRPIPRRLRHAYRVAVAADPGGVPSPFLAAEATEYERWRRDARGLVGRLMLSDLAKAVRCAVPEEYGTLKRRLPGLTTSLRKRYVENNGMWA